MAHEQPAPHAPVAHVGHRIVPDHGIRGCIKAARECRSSNHTPRYRARKAGCSWTSCIPRWNGSLPR